MIIWHYPQWTVSWRILHALSSISARLLLRQDTENQSTDVLLEGMSESCSHAGKRSVCVVVSPCEHETTVPYMHPAFLCTCTAFVVFVCLLVNIFAWHVMICGKNRLYLYFACVCVHTSNAIRISIWLNLLTLFTQREWLHRRRETEPYTPGGGKSSFSVILSPQLLHHASLWSSEHLHKR